MTESSAHSREFPDHGDRSAPVRRDPIEVVSGAIDHRAIQEFRRRVFSSVHELERLRDWVESPMAGGIQRGLVLWALGDHQRAVEVLEGEARNPAIAVCLARSYHTLGRYDDAEKVLSASDIDPVQAAALLRVVEARGDGERLQREIERLGDMLEPVERLYFRGRAREFAGDALGAIAAYDEVLAQDEQHAEALFRLALNVDLRGEDEEARELYERALMIPPVNESVVMNLGVLYEDAGNYRRAMQCFDLVLQASPNNPRARMFRRDAAAALSMFYDEDQERREDKRNKVLRTPINDFELSVRSRNCLAKMGVYTLGDLVKKTEAELLSYKNFGETSLLEIKEILKNKGLRLGMGQDELMTASIGETDEPQLASEEMPDPSSPDPSRRPVTELDLSVRSRRIVDLLKIRSIGDLANKTEAELLACPNFGQTSLNEIKTKLDELGLSLRG
ncbi:MAG: tetratricopeptide repeat protein [Planctomycetes bacterium]|nr:tetratricopeptide repeat protein [Planctomycetota bacterium]